jgi:uncharacterized protein (DUF2062 family)
MFSKLLRGIRSLLARALTEHASPSKVGFSVALGTFCSCTPFILFHLWLSLGLATIFHLNRVWAAVGSRATTAPILPFAVFAEVQLAHRIRTGAFLPLSPHDALAHGGELLIDWFAGTPIVGGVYAAILGTVAYAVARARQARLRPPSPGEPRPVSSGSPP